ncbi:hypothetical protein PMAYCL1PPCAC_01143, partial [Pristionchus mayeri]
AAIIGALSARFGSCIEPLSREEQRTVTALATILTSGREGNLECRQSDHHVTMKSTVPAGNNVEIYNIPPGATSKVQPCDVTLFRQMKSFIKKITGHIRLHKIDFIISTRDNILLVISQMYCFNYNTHIDTKSEKNGCENPHLLK